MVGRRRGMASFARPTPRMRHAPGRTPCDCSACRAQRPGHGRSGLRADPGADARRDRRPSCPPRATPRSSGSSCGAPWPGPSDARRRAGSGCRTGCLGARPGVGRCRDQCTVHTMQGSNDRTMCCTATGVASPTPTGAPTRAASSAPGVPPASRGEKFQLVGATIW